MKPMNLVMPPMNWLGCAVAGLEGGGLPLKVLVEVGSEYPEDGSGAGKAVALTRRLSSEQRICLSRTPSG
jgi:hypothetical protein